MAWLLARHCMAMLAAAVVGSAALGGCTSSPGQRVPEPAGVVYSGRVTVNAVYFDGSVELAPPGHAKPRLTWQQALNHCDGGCDYGTTPHVSLAIATTPQTGSLRADGTTKPASARVLSYVVISRNQQCWSSGGPAPGPGRPRSTMLAALCDKVQLINANTGKIEYAAYGKQ